MEKLKNIEGVFYTQNIENIPIEKRIFFREGLVANVNDFRIATETELHAWEDWKKEQEQLNEELI